MLTVTSEPVGSLPKAWRHWPFATEYQEDAPLNITKEVDIHSFGMTMIEVHYALSCWKIKLQLTDYVLGLYTNKAISRGPRLAQYNYTTNAAWPTSDSETTEYAK